MTSRQYVCKCGQVFDTSQKKATHARFCPVHRQAQVALQQTDLAAARQTTEPNNAKRQVVTIELSTPDPSMSMSSIGSPFASKLARAPPPLFELDVRKSKKAKYDETGKEKEMEGDTEKKKKKNKQNKKDEPDDDMFEDIDQEPPAVVHDGGDGGGGGQQTSTGPILVDVCFLSLVQTPLLEFRQQVEEIYNNNNNNNNTLANPAFSAQDPPQLPDLLKALSFMTDLGRNIFVCLNAIYDQLCRVETASQNLQHQLPAALSLHWKTLAESVLALTRFLDDFHKQLLQHHTTLTQHTVTQYRQLALNVNQHLDGIDQGAINGEITEAISLFLVERKTLSVWLTILKQFYTEYTQKLIEYRNHSSEFSKTFINVTAMHVLKPLNELLTQTPEGDTVINSVRLQSMVTNCAEPGVEHVCLSCKQKLMSYGAGTMYIRCLQCMEREICHRCRIPKYVTAQEIIAYWSRLFAVRTTALTGSEIEQCYNDAEILYFGLAETGNKCRSCTRKNLESRR